MVTSRPLRLLNVISSVNPRDGGPMEWVRQYGTCAQAQGHDIHVLSLDPPQAPWVREFPLRTFAVGAQAKGFWSTGLLRFLRERATEYDAVIAHGLWRFPSFGTWLGLRRSPVPYFVYTHGMLDPWFNQAYPLKTVFKGLYYRLTEAAVLRDARAVLFTCEEEKRLAATSFRPYAIRQGLCLPLGIASPPPEAERQRAAFEERFPNLTGRPYLLFLSRIHPKKGCDLLIRAFAEQARQDQALQLVMAGPDQTGWQGELQTMAQQLGVANRIHWTGMISGDVKWGAIRGAEAFVLTSHQENFGIAVVEAMACGVPVLISDKINIYKEIVADGAGICATDDQSGATELLGQWLAMDDDQRQTMRQRTRDSYLLRFEVDAATRTLLQAIAAEIS